MSKYKGIPFEFHRQDENTMLQNAQAFYTAMRTRRSVRAFADTPIPDVLIEEIIRTAGTAPSGAHKQPWTFCIVRDPGIKKQIREAAEKEEKISYSGRMPQDWIDDLEPLGTDWRKPFLETAPALIVVFRRNYETINGKTKNNYYVQESVGLATGFLIAAIHMAGLVTLTHTPSPMQFLKDILQRPDNERPFLLLPIGYPAVDATVPDLQRKDPDEISVWYR